MWINLSKMFFTLSSSLCFIFLLHSSRRALRWAAAWQLCRQNETWSCVLPERRRLSCPLWGSRHSSSRAPWTWRGIDTTESWRRWELSCSNRFTPMTLQLPQHHINTHVLNSVKHMYPCYSSPSMQNKSWRLTGWGGSWTRPEENWLEQTAPCRAGKW